MTAPDVGSGALLGGMVHAQKSSWNATRLRANQVRQPDGEETSEGDDLAQPKQTAETSESDPGDRLPTAISGEGPLPQSHFRRGIALEHRKRKLPD